MYIADQAGGINVSNGVPFAFWPVYFIICVYIYIVF